MEVIFRPRQMGKTTDLIKKCAEKGGYIVCISHENADRIFKQSKKMGLKIPLPITYQEFIDKQYYGKGIKKFHIDNIDMLLRLLTDVPIETVTITNNDNP